MNLKLIYNPRHMLSFHIISIFPEAVKAYIDASILGRAQKEKYISVVYADPRKYAGNKWGKVDDRPYAGGPGMVMMAEPILLSIKQEIEKTKKQKNKKLR